MKNILLFVLLALAVASCKKEDDTPTHGDLRVRFTLNYDNQPLVFNETVPYDYNTFLKFTKLEFFLSDIQIRGAQGTTRLADLSLLDFSQSNNTLGGATGGLALDINDVAAGEYTGIEFGVGLRPDLNATLPASYPSSHPMSDLSRYWAGWNSYIFQKIEGKFDTLQLGDFAGGFTYHTGMDTFYRNVALNKNFKIDGNIAVNEIVVSFDVKSALRKDGQALNVKVDNLAHGPGSIDIIGNIVNSYSNAFKIN